MNPVFPPELGTIELLIIAFLFVWSGFVRSALGFGGAVLTLPFALLVYNAPLFFLPIIAVHLLFFSALTVVERQWRHRGRAEGTVNWGFLRYALSLMIVPKLIGVAGVILLPADITSGLIFALVAFYSVGYLRNRPFRPANRRLDAVLMAIGGYISGTSLVAAPLVVPVAETRMPKEQLRDTLFVLWFVLVSLKLIAFVASGVDMHWRQHLWALPCATLGHVIGLWAHGRLLRGDASIFYRVLGGGLLAVSAIGLLRSMLA